MKKRSTFKVAALESLETRELLSTATAFRPAQLRASQLAGIKTVQTQISTTPGASTTTAAFHVQGGPSATVAAQTKAKDVKGTVFIQRTNHAALLNAAIARRAQRLVPTAATSVVTTVAVSSTPTTLAPKLPFNPASISISRTGSQKILTSTSSTSSKGAIAPITFQSLAMSGTATTTTPATTAGATSPTAATTTATTTTTTTPTTTAVATTTPVTTASTTTATAAATAPIAAVATSTSSPSLTANSVLTYKQAVDLFANTYTGGVDISKDAAAVTALNTSLTLLGMSAWPNNTAITQAAVTGLQNQVNVFLNTYTGGTNPSADSAAWNALSSGLALFSKSAAATPATSGTANAEGAISGLISGILSSGAPSASTLASFRTAVDGFASSYTAGTNTATDKLAMMNLVTSLNSLAASQWGTLLAASSTPAASSAVAATPIAATSTTVATPVATTTSTVLPAVATTPTPIAAATTTTTASDTTSKSGVLFTAIRAPGV